ncbi:hypothetical protein MRB53_031144 [Persea americana]|uniref:Uncharacterized protein n=1 Tax=Persea americana TaxID=3435 RepID=A0ACC2KNL9_PERAE|nr:hypothetical protein MRB53_031144 [Persea americana]|eukprot:TRINITY_DN4390_c0_g1_i2.p1 TRINITY_DN4390_c0_g1~~TRINITY_DN4390_c0_g1_i2.p1  ORF type:complete len:578 (+),score=105.31 TRINITY_DN4390_c0_g1_i2:205-1938(+)
MEQLVNFIIRPPRADYSPKNDLLDQEFMLKGRRFQRKDLEVTNSRGDILQCSHYMPLNIPEGKTLPCVIYCHGNSGCRADASEAAIILLPSNITVFTLDFSGSGISGGEHVTLGWNEKDDLKAVVNHLRADGSVSCIGLWGRSMGAVTSLMYGAEDPSIAGMVLDSPFSNLVDLMMELVDTYKVRLPKFTVKFAIQYMRKVILRKAKFDIMDLNAIQVAKSCFVPVLLGHAIDDDFIRPHHSDRIYDAYVGDKNVIKFDGDHNSPRPQFYFDSITIFFHNVLDPPKDVFEGNYFQAMHDYYGKDSWNTMNALEYSLSPMKASKVTELTGGTTEDAIDQVRSKRPMSRMDVPDDIPSEDKHPEQLDKLSEHDLGSSSSRLITFDFSNGHSCSPLIPTTMDDQYMEYSFDGLADFPYNVEDEERMFMEAVIESLKDLEIRHPHDEGQPPSVGSITPISSVEAGPDTSTAEHAGPLVTVSSSTSASHDSDSHECSSSGGFMPNGPTVGTSSASAVSASSVASASSDLSTSVPGSPHANKSSQEADVTGGTRATITVQRNPASHVIDGLVHRWGLNFFRNS